LQVRLAVSRHPAVCRGVFLLGRGLNLDEDSFRRFLKKMGKKAHVVDGLVDQVRRYEHWLTAAGLTLDTAGSGELQAYVNSLEPDEAKKQMRGVGLYYQSSGPMELAKLARGIRERGIAKTRQNFKLRDFRGVDPAAVAKLEAEGIVTVEDMLEAGNTPAARGGLCVHTGVPQEVILELVKLSDLARLGAVRAVRARLYYDAGLDTPARFAGRNPEDLRQMLIDFVADTGFNGIPPTSKEIRSTVRDAEMLPELIEYGS